MRMSKLILLHRLGAFQFLLAISASSVLWARIKGIFLKLNYNSQSNKMAEGVEVLAKPDNLSSIPNYLHDERRGPTLQICPLNSTCMPRHVFTHSHTYTDTRKMSLKWSNTYTGDSMRLCVLIFHMPLSLWPLCCPSHILCFPRLINGNLVLLILKCP